MINCPATTNHPKPPSGALFSVFFRKSSKPLIRLKRFLVIRELQSVFSFLNLAIISCVITAPTTLHLCVEVKLFLSSKVNFCQNFRLFCALSYSKISFLSSKKNLALVDVKSKRVKHTKPTACESIFKCNKSAKIRNTLRFYKFTQISSKLGDEVQC